VTDWLKESDDVSVPTGDETEQDDSDAEIGKLTDETSTVQR
jgi:hypothetical protein